LISSGELSEMIPSLTRSKSSGSSSTWWFELSRKVDEFRLLLWNLRMMQSIYVCYCLLFVKLNCPYSIENPH
jgi:hypothetical protein